MRLDSLAILAAGLDMLVVSNSTEKEFCYLTDAFERKMMPLSNPNWEIQPVEIYPSSVSVRAGNVIDFHISVLETNPSGMMMLEIFRTSQVGFGPYAPDQRVAADIFKGNFRERIAIATSETPLFSQELAAVHHDTPSDAYATGCSWPSTYSWTVPASLPSDVLIARITYQNHVSYALFVVRDANPGAGRILCQLSTNTYQAYNPWLGRSYYTSPNSLTLSYQRPLQLWDYIIYEQQIVRWLQQHYPVSFCTNLDLHQDSTLLDDAQLFISCGHDEYWSERMRDRVEAFGRRGGNLLIFSGNTCYRPVSFTADSQTMRRTAGSWGALGRFEAETIGVNWSAGFWSKVIPTRGYTTQRPDHWAFEGTGLTQGQVFGHTEGIIGYETDATPWSLVKGDLVPNISSPEAKGVPLGFTYLATADLPDWEDKRGFATMGVFRQERGLVVNAASTQWGPGLEDNNSTTSKVSHNLVETLRYLTPPPAGGIYAIDGEGDMRFFVDALQDASTIENTSTRIGRGSWDKLLKVFPGGDGIIYAITSAGQLLFYRDHNRDGTGNLRQIGVIGRGAWQSFKFVFSGGDGAIYAINDQGDLLFYRDENRNGSGDVNSPTIIGHGGWNTFTNVFSGGGGVIYAITAGGQLRIYRDKSRDGSGSVHMLGTIGQSGWNSLKLVFSGGDGIIYAVTHSGQLRFYQDSTRDGTGDLRSIATIASSGWADFTNCFGGNV